MKSPRQTEIQGSAEPVTPSPAALDFQEATAADVESLTGVFDALRGFRLLEDEALIPAIVAALLAMGLHGASAIDELSASLWKVRELHAAGFRAAQEVR
jgi:hypothetical protein